MVALGKTVMIPFGPGFHLLLKRHGLHLLERIASRGYLAAGVQFEPDCSLQEIVIIIIVEFSPIFRTPLQHYSG